MAKSKRKFYKTTFVLEVLSEEPYETTALEDIHYDITDGHCSGELRRVKQVRMGAVRTAKALLKQRSEPEFFGLTATGEEDGSYELDT
jgi:hypothetical protein